MPEARTGTGKPVKRAAGKAPAKPAKAVGEAVAASPAAVAKVVTRKAAKKAPAVSAVLEEAVASVEVDADPRGASTRKPSARKGAPKPAPEETAQPAPEEVKELEPAPPASNPWTMEDARRLRFTDGYSAEQVKKLTGHSV